MQLGLETLHLQTGNVTLKQTNHCNQLEYTTTVSLVTRLTVSNAKVKTTLSASSLNKT